MNETLKNISINKPRISGLFKEAERYYSHTGKYIKQNKRESVLFLLFSKLRRYER